jgi:cytochrome c biogenesis protein CcdA/thiol-disulfide isomerase/thioredoxin
MEARACTCAWVGHDRAVGSPELQARRERSRRLLPDPTPNSAVRFVRWARPGTEGTGGKGRLAVLLLYGIGFVAGLIAGISPCILPVLPVVLVAGATVPTTSETAIDRAPEDEPAPSAWHGPGARVVERGPPRSTRTPRATRTARAARAARRSYRPFAVVAGLVVSFSVVVLVGSSLLSFIGLPQDFLRDAGLAILGAVALGLMIPSLGHVLERPFARFGRRQPTGSTSGFVLGLGLGLVFVPCAGPVLAAISSVSAMHHVGAGAVVLTIFFALGAAVPLLIFALAGQRVAERVAAFRSHAGLARRLGGAVLLVMMLLIAFSVTDGLQRDVPGYTNVLQRHIEGGSYAKQQLAALTSGKAAPTSLVNCQAGLSMLENCGPAPNFTGITTWLNTPGDRPLSLSKLGGKVVLVDFWTYSCINCQRTLPHVESWYARYHPEGFVVVGVHTPEFSFEHVVSNVSQAAQQLGVDYPVAVDNGYKTWTAYDNNSWPAEYLIDAQGQIRHVEIGEGDYSTTESLIRQLLVSADPHAELPPTTHVPNRTPQVALTPESYLGYERLDNFAGTGITPDQAAQYQFPSSLPPSSLALSGTWTVGSESITAGRNARLELQFQAHDVYLVLGGQGTLEVSVDEVHTQTIGVSGIPRLYTMVEGPSLRSSTLLLTMSAGIQAYDFTFG